MSDTNKEIAMHIMTAVNSFCNTKKVAEHMMKEHRTLQQTFTRLCVDWLKTLAEMECYDDRNEASVQLAKSLMEIPEVKTLLEKTSLPMI